MARQKDPELDRRLLAATWSLLTTDGYEALTFAKVAAEAGAHRTDVYRRWATKVRLVIDALAAHLPPMSAVDTGALRSDLKLFLDELAAAWSMPWMDGVVSVFVDLRNDPEADDSFTQLARRRSLPVIDALHRAVERGEITQMPDLPLLGGMIEGPLMHRRVFARDVPTADELQLVLESIMHTLTVTEAAETTER